MKKVEILDVYKNFSNEIQEKIQREGWTIGLYSDDEIPYSIMAKQERLLEIETVDILLINEKTWSVKVEWVIVPMITPSLESAHPKTSFTNADALFISELTTVLWNKINERKH